MTLLLHGIPNRHKWLVFAETKSTLIYSVQFKTNLEPDTAIVFDATETLLNGRFDPEPMLVYGCHAHCFVGVLVDEC